MKLVALPSLTRGIDVLTPESELKKGAVRRATNVVITDAGSWSSRPGYSPHITLANAHSYWKSPAQTRVMVAAGDTLYDVDLAQAAAGALFVGLDPDHWLDYTEIGPDIYFVDGSILRRITSTGLVRRPGVAALGTERPTLAQTAGGLYPGRYGVSYSLLNDLGEESGLSGIEYVDVTTGGITVSAIVVDVPNVTQVNLYVTAPNGSDLYLHRTIDAAASSSITDQTKTRIATGHGLQPMPGGDFVRYYRGRLYVVKGPWVWISEPLHYGLVNIETGFLTFGRTITMFEPVENGIFVGLRERTLFLKGSGPENFEQTSLTDRGAVAYTGARAAADYFAPEFVPDRGFPVATWLSERGMAIGRADGSILFPQEDRISLVADRGRALFLQHGGIKQVIYCVESLTLGTGGSATTDFTLIGGVARSIGDSSARGRGRKIKFPNGVGESFGSSAADGVSS